MDILTFALTVGKLKRTKRSGWVKWKVPNPESVADHYFRTIVLTLILSEKAKLDTNKTTKMAILHDFGEAVIGDLITIGEYKEIDLTLKDAQELAGFKKLISYLASPKEYLDLYNEFNENKTPEARFVHQIDRLEMLLQAAEYEQEYNMDLQSFFTNSSHEITIPLLKKILDEIEKTRPKK